MNKFCLVLIGFIVLGGVFSSTPVFAQVSVGVKKGDWIEYTVTYVGSPPNTYPTWVKIEVTNIQGTSITADLTVERLDGTSETNSDSFDLETGVLDLLLIPAGLEASSMFYHKDFGDITIAGIEEDTYAGAQRTVIYAGVEQTSFHWDKVTGILLQANQYADDFTQTFLATKTNMWQIHLFGLDLTLLLMFFLIIAAIIAALIFILYRRR